MNNILIITGASGHVGKTIIQQLRSSNLEIRALVHANHPECVDTDRIKYYQGDISKLEDIEPMFLNAENRNVSVIHSAAYIDISAKKLTKKLKAVNVTGTENAIALSKKYKVKKFVFVSSVDAFLPQNKLVGSSDKLCTEEDSGGYSMSKALSTKIVREEIAKNSFPGVIVYPSAIIGPNDTGRNHMIQLITDYLERKIPAVIKGGYDIVDVRDVSKGIIDSLECPNGSELFLTGKFYTLKEYIDTIKKLSNRGRSLVALPIWVAKLGLPFLQLAAKVKRTPPLYTSFSLSTIKYANTFDIKSTKKLIDYKPRDLNSSLKDTLRYLELHYFNTTK